jgi:hypothetical protein
VPARRYVAMIERYRGPSSHIQVDAASELAGQNDCIGDAALHVPVQDAMVLQAARDGLEPNARPRVRVCDCAAVKLRVGQQTPTQFRSSSRNRRLGSPHSQPNPRSVPLSVTGMALNRFHGPKSPTPEGLRTPQTCRTGLLWGLGGWVPWNDWVGRSRNLL